MTVGKVYAGLLIIDNWKTTRFGQLTGEEITEKTPPESPADSTRLMGIRNSNSRASHGSLYGDDEGYGETENKMPRSRTGSVHQSNLSIEKIKYGEEKNWKRSFSFLRTGSSRRKRKEHNDQGENGHLRPDDYGYDRRLRSRSPSPSGMRMRGRSPSPRRGYDIGFSDAVSDVVDIVNYQSSRRGRAIAMLRGNDDYINIYGSPIRGRSPVRGRQEKKWRGISPSPDYHHTTCLDRRSRSPSPNPTPTHRDNYWGRISLEYRSRSPSPSSAHSLPLQRRPRGRRLPPTPKKPSTLRLDVKSMEGMHFPLVSHSPTVPQSARSINFPKVNASPTHFPRLQIAPPPVWKDRAPHYMIIGSSSSLPIHRQQSHPPDFYYPPHRPSSTPHRISRGQMEEPLSFETAAAIGRGSRQLPSPLPNGYKPGHRERQRREWEQSLIIKRTGRVGGTNHRSESDDDDWC